MKTTKNKRSSRTVAAGPASSSSAVSERDAAAEQVESQAAVSPSTRSIVLPASCTLREAVSLKAALLDSLGVEDAVSMDAHAVERIDTAGAQVLAAFVRERAAQARTVEWLGLSETFLEAVRLLGLNSTLNIADTAGVGA